MIKISGSDFGKRIERIDVNEHDFIERDKVSESARKEQRFRALEIAMLEILVESASALNSRTTNHVLTTKLKRIADTASVMMGAGENTKLVPMVYSLDLVNAVNVLFPKAQTNESIHDSGGGEK